MNFQAQSLMALVGKKPCRYRRRIAKLLNLIRDLKATTSLLRSEKTYLLKQIRERDEMIESLHKKNLALTEWQKLDPPLPYTRVSTVA